MTGWHSLYADDHREWARLWRACTVRRLTHPPSVDVSEGLGEVDAVTVFENPSEYADHVPRESSTCPICGNVTENESRLPATLDVSLKNGFSYLLGVWVHRCCFDQCPNTGEVAPVPW